MKPSCFFISVVILLSALAGLSYGQEEVPNDPVVSLNANLTQQQLLGLPNDVFLTQFLSFIFTGRYDGQTEMDDTIDEFTIDDLIDVSILFFVGQVESELDYQDGYDLYNPILLDLRDIQVRLRENGTTAVKFKDIKKYLTLTNARNLVLFYFYLNRETIMKRAQEYLSREYLGGTSGNCKLHNQLWFNDLPKGELWALQMFDAAAKPPAGLFKGNINWVGSYQGCKDVKNDLVSPPIKGKYCRSYISFPLDQVGDLNDLPIDDKIRFTYGLCVPDSCSENEVNSIISNSLKLMTIFKVATANETECDDHYETTSWGTFYIVLICIIVGWVLVSTIYDAVASTLEHFRHSVIEDPPYVIENKQYIAGTGAVSPIKKVQPPKRSRFAQFMTNCSLYSNSIKFFRTDNGGKITCLNGIRFFSMFWIIFGHTFNYIADRYKFFLLDNVIWLQELNEQWYAQLIINGMFAVDTFFLMSAFLLSLGFMRKLEKSKALKAGEWVYYYVHRYWRLAPPFLLTIVIYVYIFPYLGQGPLFETGDFPPRAENCKKYWYSFVFMINNFVPTDSEQQCMGYLWYIPNDFQLYIISPLFIILLYKFPIAGMALLTSALAGSLTILAMLTSNVYVSRKKNIVFVLFDMWSDVYVKPYCRASPWIVGIVLGYVFFKFKKVKLHYVTVILGWTMSTAFALTALFGGYTNHGKDTRRMETAEYALYFSLSKLLWPLAIGWIIFACHYGYGGVINTFLSIKSFVPLNRLSYCAYLIHPMFMQLFNYSQETLFHGTGFTLVYAAAGNVFISLFMAFFFTLLFEWPFIAVEKLVYSPSRD